ncbi:MAG: sigma-70 factor domain-containing protein, partial [Cyanobacteria bacterium J06639_18]
MPATSFYADATYDSQQSNPQVFDPEIAVDESELPTDSIEDLEIAAQESVESVESVSHNTNTSRRSTDLVRLYLQEIGRVRLLGRDEEVSEAQKVQRYLRLRILLSESAKQDREDIISSYLQIVEIHERLTSELGHRPSFERWAKTAGMEVVELKQMLSQGKRR